MKRLPCLLAVVFVLSAALRAEEYEPQTFGAPDGRSIPYRLLKPQDYENSRQYPLVVFLHGAGERGTDNQAQLKHCVSAFARPEVRKAHPCFVMVPQCPPQQQWVDMPWSGDSGTQPAEPSAPLQLVLGAVAALQQEFSIDPDRLYLSGISMGGFGTWDAITRDPGKWAAAAPICGGGDKRVAARAAKVPVWAFHGTADNAVKVVRTRDMIEAMKAGGGRPLYSEYPNVAHDSWTPAYQEPELLPWLFAQRRGQAPVPFARVAPAHAQPPSSEFPGAGPVQPGIWFRALWRQRREQWSRDAAKDQGAIVFFGDSITQGWNSLANDFPESKVANRGLSGDTTRGLRFRVSEDVLAVKPRAVSMLIGTNDLALGAEPELVAGNIKAVVAELRAADARMPVVINKVMPRGRQPGRFPERIQELNALLEIAFRNDPQITFCDTWSIFDDGTGVCKKEEFPDMLHPNAAGYAKWRSALAPILEGLKRAP
ncbi:MAG: GDSL-type esterase/lipase family protein [Verrucomicrobiota bacterium]|nr:GDSL-type esterase/lipase family protein [Verrucomicrobiota bacterium]